MMHPFPPSGMPQNAWPPPGFSPAMQPPPGYAQAAPLHLPPPQYMYQPTIYTHPTPTIAWGPTHHVSALEVQQATIAALITAAQASGPATASETN